MGLLQVLPLLCVHLSAVLSALHHHTQALEACELATDLVRHCLNPQWLWAVAAHPVALRCERPLRALSRPLRLRHADCACDRNGAVPRSGFAHQVVRPVAAGGSAAAIGLGRSAAAAGASSLAALAAQWSVAAGIVCSVNGRAKSREISGLPSIDWPQGALRCAADGMARHCRWPCGTPRATRTTTSRSSSTGWVRCL